MRLVRDWDKLKSPIVIRNTIVSLLMYLDPVGLLLLVHSCMALCKLDVVEVGSLSAYVKPHSKFSPVILPIHR